MKIIKDLFTGPDGSISATKFWLHAGNITATYIMYKLAASDQMDWMFLAVYMAIVAGSPIANKIIAARSSHKGKSNGTTE